MAAIAPMGCSYVRWSERMLKKIGLVILVVALFVVIFTFYALNPGEVDVDLGFSRQLGPCRTPWPARSSSAWYSGCCA